MISIEVQFFRKFLNKQKISFKLYFLIIVNIPLDLIEFFLRYIPGAIGFFLRRYYYKFRLHKVGKNFFIDVGVHFIGHKNIEISEYVYIDKNCIITALDKLIIGKRVHISPFCILHAGLNGPITIGDFVGLSANTKVYSSVDKNVPNKRLAGPMILDCDKVSGAKPINFAQDSWVAPNCLILPGANIEYGAIISPNTVVRGKIEKLSVIDSKGEKIKYREFDL